MCFSNNHLFCILFLSYTFFFSFCQHSHWAVSWVVFPHPEINRAETCVLHVHTTFPTWNVNGEKLHCSSSRNPKIPWSPTPTVKMSSKSVHFKLWSLEILWAAPVHSLLRYTARGSSKSNSGPKACVQWESSRRMHGPSRFAPPHYVSAFEILEMCRRDLLKMRRDSKEDGCCRGRL